MPYRCVRCTFELPDPPSDRCPHCGAEVSRSLPATLPHERQHTSSSAENQVLAGAESSADAQYYVQRADFVTLSSPNNATSGHVEAEQRKTPRSLWLPVGVAVLLAALLIGTVVRLPIGSVIGHLRSATPIPATPTTKPHPYEFHDTLQQGNAHGWPVGQGRCFFAQDGYHVKDGQICQAPVLPLKNGKIVVTVKILADPQASTEEDVSVGMWFRTQDVKNGYVIALGQNSTWWMGKTVNGQTTTMSQVQRHEAIHPGLSVVNAVEILMRADDFTVYVNNIQVGSAVDATFAAGTMAFVAIPGAEAVFSDLSVIADQ